jgi:hypothetical protein
MFTVVRINASYSRRSPHHDALPCRMSARRRSSGLSLPEDEGARDLVAARDVLAGHGLVRLGHLDGDLGGPRVGEGEAQRDGLLLAGGQAPREPVVDRRGLPVTGTVTSTPNRGRSSGAGVPFRTVTVTSRLRGNGAPATAGPATGPDTVIALPSPNTCVAP